MGTLLVRGGRVVDPASDWPLFYEKAKERSDNFDIEQGLKDLAAALAFTRVHGNANGRACVFGYCFGVFETMARIAGLDQYSEGAQMMERAFGKLVNKPDLGPQLFRVALDLKVDANFNEGAERGENEVAAWHADANAIPTGITQHAARRA